MSWSSGKDCAFALHEARAAGDVEVVGLLTTMNEAADRVAMHGVRRELLRRQAAALGLAAFTVELPDPCTNEIYEQRMGAFVEQVRAEGVEVVIFGDLFLEEVRAYRERQLEGTGIEPAFPLWGRPTRVLAEEMLASGVVATLSCVDTRKLPAEMAGRRWDARLLRELPEGVDPCGENGEFHTFVSAGPGFTEAIDVRPGELVVRGDFAFVDLLPA
jgi:uncharacterized protein (TIGR00290 family)